MHLRVFTVAVTVMVVLAACGPAAPPIPPSATGGPTAPAPSGKELTLNGAGSSFDYPLFSKVFAEYTKLHPDVRVNYQSVGSGAGIQQLTQGTVDFGATDAPMTDEQVQAAGSKVVHVPVTLGAVAVAYNLPGTREGIKLSGDVLARIYLGEIKKWNDPQIASLNPDVPLPGTDIAVVHRSDGSGTTDIFTTYLAAVSPDWKQKVGAGLSVSWPVGLGGKGSEGVAGQVKQIPGGIGYFELAYAKQSNLTSTAIGSGDQFLLPSSDGATACAAGAAGSLPPDLRVKIAGCTGPGAYPISGFSWVVMRQDLKDPARGQALVDLLAWLVHDGQQYSSDLDYAPLPAPVVNKVDQVLDAITAGGAPLKPSR